MQLTGELSAPASRGSRQTELGKPGRAEGCVGTDGAPRLGGRWLGPAEEEPAGTTPPHPAFPGVTGTFCPMPALSQRELWLFAQGVTALQCDLGVGFCTQILWPSRS